MFNEFNNNKRTQKSNVMSGWTHSIVATHENKVISITTRNFEHEVAGVLHKFLNVPLDKEKIRRPNKTVSFNYSQLNTALLLFKDYQQYKEIEFLKVCLEYFNNDQVIENINFTFINE